MRAHQTYPSLIPPIEKKAGLPKGTKQQWVPELDVPAHIETQLKAALQPPVVQEDEIYDQEGALPLGGPAVNVGPISAEEAVSRISQTYEELQHQGFEACDIERGISFLVSQVKRHYLGLDKAQLPVVTVTPVLEWLLYHLDRTKLPRLYADQVHARGGTAGNESVRRPVNMPQNTALFACQDATDETEKVDAHTMTLKPSIDEEGPMSTAILDNMTARKDDVQSQKDDDGDEEKSKKAHKTWLLSRLADSSSSASCSDDSDESGGESDLELDMWGADPVEVQRQKILKARQNLSRADRIGLIREEMFRAKESATRAKSEGDKNGQKEYGRVIGELRKEMASLGLTDADLVPVNASSSQVDRQQQDNQVNEKHIEEKKEETNQDTIPFDALFDGGGGGDGNEGGVLAALESTEPAEERAAKRRLKKLEAAGFLSRKGTNVVKLQSREPQTRRSNPSQNMQYNIKKGGIMPKAALQKYCQTQGWPAPTYTRLPFAPGSDVNSGHRYSVSVKRLSSSGMKPYTSGRSRSTTSRFILPESLNGWSSSEDAQNAVATLALVTFCDSTSSNSEMWKDFKDPLFAELWLTLLEEQGGAISGNGQETEPVQRDTFARSILDKYMMTCRNDVDVDVDSKPNVGSTRVVSANPNNQSRAAQNTATATSSQKSNKRVEDAAKTPTQKKNMESESRFRKRQKLPVAAIREELLGALAVSDIAVVSGDTGSGKTTQVPQFILDESEENNEICNIICTQPRRIAAISVAERVAQEREEPSPGKPGSTVGYAVRLDTAMNRNTKLLFCTTGILLRRMASDPHLTDVTHVIVDEVHERTVQGDFLMALLRDLVLVRRRAGHRPLKIILMSATLDSAKLSEYFGSCPTLHAQGRTFPVQHLFLEDVYEWLGDSYVLSLDSPAALKGWGNRSRQYLQSGAVRSKHRAMVAGGWGDEIHDATGEEVLNPYVKDMIEKDPDALASYSARTRRNLARLNEEMIDYDLLEELVGQIHETQSPGAVLVFLPGMGEIVRALGRLEANKRFADCWFIALHSSINSAEQRKAFRSPPRGYSRKIVLSTNIAETSLTIEDIVYVVDSGKVKERRYDAKRAMSSLVETWVSIASAKQRQGRAGRVRPGICYCLYPQYLFVSGRMKAFQVPEVARVPLEELVLQIHHLGVSPSLKGGAVAFTSRLLQPPPVKIVEGAVRVLKEVGALEVDMQGFERLTPLGNLLARLPVDVRLGKLLILGACLRCISPTLSIAACASIGGGAPFDSGRLSPSPSPSLTPTPTPTQHRHPYWSDHLDMAAAVDGWLAAMKSGNRGMVREYVRKHGLRQEVLEMVADVRKQFAVLLEDAGVIESRNACDDPHSTVNLYSLRHAVVKCAIVGAMAPQVISRGVVGVSDAGETLPYWHDGLGPVAPHPSSSCAKLVTKNSDRVYPFVAYQEKVLQGSSTKPAGGHAHLRDCTAVNSAALVIAGGGELVIDYETGRLEIRYASNTLVVRTSARSGVMAARVRRGLDMAVENIVDNQLRWKETAERIVDVIAAWLREEENSQRMLHSG